MVLESLHPHCNLHAWTRRERGTHVAVTGHSTGSRATQLLRSGTWAPCSFGSGVLLQLRRFPLVRHLQTDMTET